MPGLWLEMRMPPFPTILFHFTQRYFGPTGAEDRLHLSRRNLSYTGEFSSRGEIETFNMSTVRDFSRILGTAKYLSQYFKKSGSGVYRYYRRPGSWRNPTMGFIGAGPGGFALPGNIGSGREGNLKLRWRGPLAGKRAGPRPGISR